MSYKLKTKEFTLAMQILAGMAHLETNVDILNVSGQIGAIFFVYRSN